MMSCFHYLLLTLVLGLAFCSCNNELEVLDTNKENAAIYALLDPGQDVQYVRIGRVFTNPGVSGKKTALIPDSIYFDSIQPVLIELDNGAEKRRISLLLTKLPARDSGIFANNPNYLYTTHEQIFPEFNYRIELKLPKSGRFLSATTDLIKMITSDFYKPVNPYFYPRMILIPYDRDNDSRMEIKFSTGIHGKIYEAYFHFNTWK